MSRRNRRQLKKETRFLLREGRFRGRKAEAMPNERFPAGRGAGKGYGRNSAAKKLWSIGWEVGCHGTDSVTYQ